LWHFLKPISTFISLINPLNHENQKTFIYPVLILAFLIQSFSLFSQDFSRTDFRDETIYFVMTTRFYDGDPENNVQCWDGKSMNQGDPAWRGDFKGLIEKLDYIKALGFTSIWITPVVENASGYDYTTAGLSHIPGSTPTAIRKITGDELFFFSNSGVLFAQSSVEGDFPVYTLTGKIIRTLKIRHGRNAFHGIPGSIYIINHQKVLVK